MINQSTTRQSGCSVRRLVMEVRSAVSPAAEQLGVPLLHRYEQGIAQVCLGDAHCVGLMLADLVTEVIQLTRSDVLYLLIAQERAVDLDALIQFDVVNETAWISDQGATRIEQMAGPAEKFGSLGPLAYREIARSLGGDLVVKKVGEGTRCRLTIKNDPIEEQSPCYQLAGNSAEQRVLLVEDNGDHQHLICAALNVVSPQISLAEDGEQAIEIMEAARDAGKPFALVLMDVQLPKLDGRNATRRLREMGFDTPIVALTARTINTELDACLLAGCDDYITKPFQFAELRSSVACHLAMAGHHSAV